MNISEVNVKLSNQDILSILNEFIKIQGLELKNVIISDGIILRGTFKKIIGIDFQIKVDILKCTDNKVFVRISKVKAMNIGIFRIIRSLILKQISKIFKDYGIENNRDIAIIDIKKILSSVPYIDFEVNELYIRGSELWVELCSIEVSVAGGLIKETEPENTDESEDNEEADLLQNIDKIEDNYSKGRKKLENKLPDKVKSYKDYLFILPDIVTLIYRLLKDKRVPIKTKLIMSAAIGYMMVPSDIIPDKIPFIGAIDDIGVAFFVLNKIMNDVPINIILENWEGKNDILLVIKNGIDYLINFTAAENVEKLYEVVEELSTL
ncbi:MAG: YkvA family protein [Clostridium sp.]